VFVKLLSGVDRNTSARWARAPAVSSRLLSEESSRADTSYIPRAAENPHTKCSPLKEDGQREADIPVDKKEKNYAKMKYPRN